MSTLHLRYVDSPIGRLRLVASADALITAAFPNDAAAELDLPTDPSHRVLAQAARELDEYFSGQRQIFATPLAPQGTAFQLQVWRYLTTIPFAATCSYGQVANGIAHPKAVRAVGAANGQNRLPLFIPCHRVIGAGGQLTGFAGGLPLKRWLLAHEQNVAGGTRAQPSLFRASPGEYGR